MYQDQGLNRSQKKLFSVLIGLMLVTGFMTSCASSTTTTRTTTAATPDTSSNNSKVVVRDTGDQVKTTVYNDGNHGNVTHPAATEKTVETRTTTSTGESPGILSSTVHAVGYVISLPFRLVAGLIRLIF
jgi:hypothetical protein